MIRLSDDERKLFGQLYKGLYNHSVNERRREAIRCLCQIKASAATTVEELRRVIQIMLQERDW